MARTGGFGIGLNPFGSGSLSNLSQYNIGESLAELEVYKVEVRWGNGLATDEEYLAALTKARDATSENTRARETAQNRLDDAEYRIGRSKADEQGLDALIAFDQAALAKMNPGNLRYRSVKESLDSELAQRRSRDYGDLVRRYNKGEISTEKLVEWVDGALGTITDEDPDFQNWTDTRQELGERLQSEKDAKVYQDYQQGRMKPEAFLSYLTTRRDGFDPTSPQWDDWSRRLEDAEERVKEDRQQREDVAFFNAYEEGKKSDKDYLAYLRNRLAGMDADDPDRATWQHRLNQAAFSLAEDQLRFDVQTGKAPTSRLVTFYRNYRNTLNPGSAEYRQITRALMSLGSGGGSGGSGGRGGSSGGKGSSAGAAIGSGPKVIDPKTSLSTILPLLTINVNADKKAVATAASALDLNIARITDARQRGDSVWLFQDPRKPGQTTPGMYPDGSPMLDAAGKPVMVAGSGYLAVSDEAYTNLLGLKAGYHYGLAGKAMADNDAKGYFYQLKLAAGLEDRIRLADVQAIERSNKRLYDAVDDGIDLAMRTGDWATALNLARDLQMRLDAELENPMLDDARRTKLEALAEKLGQNPLLPQIDPLTGKRVGGAIDLLSSTVDRNGNFTNIVLNPGWHHVLDRADATGRGQWGLVFDENQDGSWEASHVAVQTTYGGQVVRGEVQLRQAPISPTVVVRTPDGTLRSESGAQYIRFQDEHGNTVKAFSLDGTTWVRSLTGTAPMVELNADIRQISDMDGTHYVDAASGERVFTMGEDGSWIRNDAYFTANPGALQWYGQSRVAQRLREAAPRKGEITMIDPTTGRYTAYDPTDSAREERGRKVPARKVVDSSGRLRGQQEMIDVEGRRGAGPVELGAPGQSMQLITLGPDGSVNLTPPRSQQWKGADFRGAPTRPLDMNLLRVQNAGKKGTTAIKAAPRNLGSPVGDRRGYDGIMRPPIEAQLSPGTPPRFDGEGWNNVPTIPPRVALPAPNLTQSLARTATPTRIPTVRTTTTRTTTVRTTSGAKTTSRPRTTAPSIPKPAPKPPMIGAVPRERL